MSGGDHHLPWEEFTSRRDYWGWSRQSRVGGRKHILFGQMDCLEEKQTIHLQRQCGSWTPSVVFLLRALGSQEILLSKKWAENQETHILLETWPGIFFTWVLDEDKWLSGLLSRYQFLRKGSVAKRKWSLRPDGLDLMLTLLFTNWVILTVMRSLSMSPLHCI